MSNLISTLDNVQTMSSREIAKLTGKKHVHVLRDIRVMLDEIQYPNLDPKQYQVVVASNKMTKEILLDKELTTTLVSGYNAKIRHAIVRRWQELESQPPKISQPPQYLRFLEHVKKVPVGYYSMIMVMQNGFTTPMSAVGVDLQADLLPDGSFGRMFNAHLRELGYNPSEYPNYPFKSASGYHGYCRCYPMNTYHIADSYLHAYWLPIHAFEYLGTRDKRAQKEMPAALSYLTDKKLQSTTKRGQKSLL